MRKTILSAIVLMCSASVFAVGTSHWTQTSEAEFKAGTFDNVVATNLGDLKLSRATKSMLAQDARISAVYALAQAADGAIFAATGPQGVLLKINGDKTETAATLGDNVNLFSLLIDSQGRLLIGTGGTKGSIYRVEKTGDKPVEIFSDDAAQYVWSIVQTKDGNVYAATGPNGKLFEIHPDGSKKIIFETDENNLLSMVSNGGDLLYVGTDPNGHIYRVNRKTGESFVVYDAPESEISALAIDSRGNVFAGTAQSAGEEPPEPAEPNAEKSGRPEADQPAAVPIPGEKPKAPKPPEMPLPGPGNPPGIPKREPDEPKKMSIQPADATDQPAEPKQAGPNQAGRKQPKIPLAQADDALPQQRSPVNAHKAGQPAANGNAVYKIDPDGFVSEVFRQNVLVFSISENNGVLLIGTGGEGNIYQVNPSAEETSVVTKVDPKEVLCLLPAKDGQIYIGMANDGQIMSMSSGFANKGTFISPVLDAQQISRFGKLHLHGNLPQETALTVATRSGNVSQTSDPGWSKWSDELPASEYIDVSAPTARFLQYRLTFESKSGARTPVVDEVSVAYQMPNLAPVIKSIKIGGATPALDAEVAAAPKPEAANATVSLSWEASDPNSDTLRYALYFRAMDEPNWVLLKDKLTETTFDWNTRAVADGRYEVKVVASDALANPVNEAKSGSRVSDPVEVDNTPPVLGDLKVDTKDGAAHLAARVVDRTSTVAKLEYAVDSSTDWQLVLPADKIADSPEERYDFTVGGLSVGSHQIGLRATDAHGNQSFETATVNITKE